jgi:osmoprotectant transport system permease protein
MSIFQTAYQYALDNPDKFIAALQEHLLLVIIPLAIGLLMGLTPGLVECPFQDGSLWL